MKAWVYREYGGPEVVHLEEVPTPVPKDDEMVIKVLATTVTVADWRARTLEMPKGFGAIGRLIFGLRRPRKAILGGEFSGVVAQVGRSVTRFRVDDAVFGANGWRMGCHAQFVVFGKTSTSRGSRNICRSRRPQHSRSAARRRSTSSAKPQFSQVSESWSLEPRVAWAPRPSSSRSILAHTSRASPAERTPRLSGQWALTG